MLKQPSSAYIVLRTEGIFVYKYACGRYQEVQDYIYRFQFPNGIEDRTAIKASYGYRNGNGDKLIIITQIR